MCLLYRCEAGKANWSGTKAKRNGKVTPQKSFKWGRVACKVARLTSSEPSLQKHVVSTNWISTTQILSDMNHLKKYLFCWFSHEGMNQRKTQDDWIACRIQCRGLYWFGGKKQVIIKSVKNTSVWSRYRKRHSFFSEASFYADLILKYSSREIQQKSQEGRKLRQWGKVLFGGSCYRFLSSQSKGCKSCRRVKTAIDSIRQSAEAGS